MCDRLEGNQLEGSMKPSSRSACLHIYKAVRYKKIVLPYFILAAIVKAIVSRVTLK